MFHTYTFCGFRVPPGLLAMLLLATACSLERTDGVISTGNAGRIQGKAISDEHGAIVTTRLIKIRPNGDSLCDSLRTDTSGSFGFRNVEPGSYRVEAWSEGKQKGRSSDFNVDPNQTKTVQILLSKPVQYLLDFSSVGLVDSLFLDYPANPGIKQGALWFVQGLKDSSAKLYARVVNSSAVGSWLTWQIKVVAGSLEIIGGPGTSNSPAVRRIDTSAFFLNSHTVALWAFDSIVSGQILDLSGNGCNLALPIGASIQPSPNGKALVARSLPPRDPASTQSPLPGPLQWTKTGMQTIEMRVKLDSFSLVGYYMVASYIGPQIGMTATGGIGIFLQVDTGTGAIWYGKFSEPNAIPIGRWVNIAASIDQASNDVCIWLDGQQLPLYPMSNGTVKRLVADPSFPIQVGGGDWDSRVGPLQLDEVKISDTLIFGKGMPTPATIDRFFDLTVVGMTNAGACASCQTFSVGPQKEASGYILVKPKIQASVQGFHAVQAKMTFLADPVSVSRVWHVFRLLKPLESLSGKTSPLIAGIDYEILPFAAGTIQAGSKGGIVFEISPLAKEWLEHPDQINGLMIKPADESMSPISVNIAASASNPPTLEIRYR